MPLPATDLDFLHDHGKPFQVYEEGGMTCVLFPEYRLPSGFTREAADLLLRLNPGYPDVPPDMWWFDPAVLRADGSVIPNTDAYEQHLGRRGQRGSRHLDASRWLPGRDSLESILALLAKDVRKHVPETVT